MNAPSQSLDGLLEGIPREQLSARITSDLHLAELGKKVTRWTEVVPYLELGEVDEEDITEDNRRVEQRRVALLRTWRQRHGHKATYYSLALAYYKAGRSDLVGGIREVLGYPPLSHPCVPLSPPQTGATMSMRHTPSGTFCVSLPAPAPSPKPDMKYLVRLPGFDWDGAGLQLDLGEDIETIKKDYSQDSKTCQREMLRIWLKRNPNASYQHLVDALCAVGENTVADQVCKKYGLSPSPPTPDVAPQPLMFSPPQLESLQLLSFQSSTGLNSTSLQFGSFPSQVQQLTGSNSQQSFSSVGASGQPGQPVSQPGQPVSQPVHPADSTDGVGCLSSRDLFTLLGELKAARAQWHYIGLGLGISNGDLQSIASKTRGDPLDSLREVLVLWLDQLGRPRTWQAVVDVLRSPVIDKKNLATQLETKYCTSTESK